MESEFQAAFRVVAAVNLSSAGFDSAFGDG
jgi:hypothetical protein